MIERTKDRTLIEFGFGSVQITSGLIDDKGVIALNECNANRIGAIVPTVDTPETLMENSDVRLRFDNMKSLEVLILKLQEVRALMMGYSLEETERYKVDMDDITKAYYPNPWIDQFMEPEAQPEPDDWSKEADNG